MDFFSRYDVLTQSRTGGGRTDERIKIEVARRLKKHMNIHMVITKARVLVQRSQKILHKRILSHLSCRPSLFPYIRLSPMQNVPHLQVLTVLFKDTKGSSGQMIVHKGVQLKLARGGRNILYCAREARAKFFSPLGMIFAPSGYPFPPFLHN